MLNLVQYLIISCLEILIRQLAESEDLFGASERASILPRPMGPR